MICPKCNAEVKESERFCSQCGTEIQKKCPDCGTVVKDVKYCPNCGRILRQAESEQRIDTDRRENGDGDKEDQYETALEKKARIEKYGNIVTFSIAGILCLILLVNNWGYYDLTEIVIMCAVVSLVILAIFSAIAAAMGFYAANRYLNKYCQMKREIGKVEAVKMIEQQYHPEEGFNLMKGGINTTSGCIGGCFSSIVGFAITIIAVILMMALC